MHTSSDIRAQIAADAMLQREISSALLAVANSLETGTDSRIVRILTRTLEAGWEEHVSFQDAVIFPIILNRHGTRVQGMIDHRRSEHASLSQQHSEVGRWLDGLLTPRAGLHPSESLGVLLRNTYAQRQSHLDCDSDLDSWLPQVFTEAESTLCCKWSELRPNLPFPLNLLSQSPRPRPRWLH